MKFIVALPAHRHKILVIVCHRLLLRKIRNAYKCPSVMHVFSTLNSSILLAPFAKWVFHQVRRSQAPPSRSVINPLPFLSFCVAILAFPLLPRYVYFCHFFMPKYK